MNFTKERITEAIVSGVGVMIGGVIYQRMALEKSISASLTNRKVLAPAVGVAVLTFLMESFLKNKEVKSYYGEVMGRGGNNGQWSMDY